MLPSFEVLKEILSSCINDKEEQGFDIAGIREACDHLPQSYDRYHELALRLGDLPYRADWPYREPDDLDAIRGECAFTGGFIGTPISPEQARGQVESGFEGSVCGCILGKPIEVNPTLAEIRRAAQECDCWPLNDYLPERLLKALNRRHNSWTETVRERITCVAADDDINYTLIGMLLLERHGASFNHENIMWTWLNNLPVNWTFGPERISLLKAGLSSYTGARPDYAGWVSLLQPATEYCGAVIRADAYGYACPGRPALAAELAWRDASWTHRKNGIYGTMYVAAAIALAHTVKKPLEVFSRALDYIPRASRLHAIVADSIEQVRSAGDWLEGYRRIHTTYRQYSHCRIYQEIGTLVNTLRFATDIGDGICKQVSQGNDTDSFGATAGSILGVFFGPGHLEPRWLLPFNDRLHTTLAEFHEQSLAAITTRIGGLPQRLAREETAAAAGEQRDDIALSGATGIH